MSLKGRVLNSSLVQRIVKLAIKLTPKILVVSVANFVLKDIAKFSKMNYDLDARTAFMKVTLHGEQDPIEVSVDGFAILNNQNNYQFVLHNAHSNKPWLTNIFARIAGKEWEIPEIPQFKDEVAFVASLLKPDNPDQAERFRQDSVSPDLPKLPEIKSEHDKQ